MHQHEATAVDGAVESPAPAVAPAPAPSPLLLTRALASRVGNQAFGRIITRVPRADMPGGAPNVPVATDRKGAIEAEVKSIVDSIIPTALLSTSKLEGLWAGLGPDLPKAIKQPGYKELWDDSVTKCRMDVDKAVAPVETAFQTDTKEAAVQIATDKRASLEHLRQDIQKADAKGTSNAPDQFSGGVHDDKTQTSHGPAKKGFEARDLIDTATLVDFLMNWDELLRKVPVARRKPDAVSPLGAPDRPPGTPETTPAAPLLPPPGKVSVTPVPAPAAGPVIDAQGFVQIPFDPAVADDQLARQNPGAEIDAQRLATIRHVFAQCDTQREAFKKTAQAMIAEDVNLQGLAQQGLLRQVSAMGGTSDTDASKTMLRTVGENIDKLGRFLDRVGGTEWQAFGPVHSMLLSGTVHGSSPFHFDEPETAEVIHGYFDRSARAEQQKAELALVGQIALAGVTLVALLTPAAPLAMGVLAAADTYAAATALTNVADSRQADKKAADYRAGADAGVVGEDAAKAAEREADERNSHLAMDLMMAALPFIPGVVKGGLEAAQGLRAESRFVQAAETAAEISGPSRLGGAATGVLATPRARALAASAQEVYEGWAGLSVEQRMGKLVEKVNPRITEMGAQPIGIESVAMGSEGRLDWLNWRIQVQESLLSGKAITEEKFCLLVDTIAHEAQHAEDWFAIAQHELNDGASVKVVAEKLHMSPDVVREADEVQKGIRPGTKLVTNSARDLEVDAMYESVYGRGYEYREQVYRDKDAAGPALLKAEADFMKISKRPRADPERAAALKAWGDAQKHVDQLEADYKALPEEVSAFAVGDAANVAMQERFALLRNLGNAEKAEKAALRELDDVSAELAAAADAGADVGRTEQAHVEAVERWRAANEATRKASEALGKTAKGHAP